MKKLKNLKNKNIILGLIAILVVMSVGFVVNSYYNTREQGTENIYSEAMEHVFKSDGSDFDGIATIQKLKPNEQYFDGISDVDKSDTVLVSKNMVLYKEDNNGNPINGVYFYLKKPNQLLNLIIGPTRFDKDSDKNGILKLTKENFALGFSKITEDVNSKGTLIVGENKKQVDLKPIEISIFKDPQVRFLGEFKADENNFITYEKLLDSFNIPEGKTKLEGITKLNNTENKWLKIWDKREGKLLYIAKQPIATVKNFKNLEQAGVVYGLDKVSPNPTTESEGKTKIKNYAGEDLEYSPNIVTINGKTYIVRMLKGTVSEITRNWSEWDVYMIPLLKEGRESQSLKDATPELLEKVKNSNNDGSYRLKTGDYSWNELNNTEYEEFVQEQETRTAVETGSPSTFVYRPVLEEFKCYDGACFEGEVNGEDFIKYNELLAKIDGKSETEAENYKKDYETVKVGNVLDLGNDSKTGGNWLKIFDAREGKTLYIAKKPLTNKVSWQDLYKAGVVYGPDQVLDESGKLKTNIDFNIVEYKRNSLEKTGNQLLPYNPKIVTINGKTYLIRLLKGTTRPYPNNTGITDEDYTKREDLTKSEWTRYMLPLTKYYRYGFWASDNQTYGYPKSYTRYLGEELTQDKYGIRFAVTDSSYHKNIETAYKPLRGWKIELAPYNWFGDLTLGAGDGFKYDGVVLNPQGAKGKGQGSLMQELLYEGPNDVSIALRGYVEANTAASIAMTMYPSFIEDSNGFRPVLEEINNN